MQKRPEPGGRVPLTQFFYIQGNKNFLLRFWSRLNQNEFQKILSIKKFLKKNFEEKKCMDIYYRFLRIFWNVCRSEFERNQSKTQFFIEIFFRRKNQKIGMKMLLNEITKKNQKIISAYILDHCASFGTRNRIWPLLR